MSELLRIRAKQAQHRAAVKAWEVMSNMEILQKYGRPTFFRDDWYEWAEIKAIEVQEECAQRYHEARELLAALAEHDSYMRLTDAIPD